jgi:uncharacterized protein (TIGR02118 family)
MIRLSILYPGRNGARFDAAYYCDQHLALARRLLTPFGLVEARADLGIGGLNGEPPPFTAIGHLDFESVDALQQALQAEGDALATDVPRFSDISPQFQISEVVISRVLQ